MWNSPLVPDGIVNAGYCYEVIGGMMDWKYRYAACNEVTIELCDDKKPDASLLPGLWLENEESMLAYIESVHHGDPGRDCQ